MLRDLELLALVYLLGSIPFAFFIPRIFRGIDLRYMGNGDLDAVNTYRVTGSLSLAIPVFIADFTKSAVGVYLASKLSNNPMLPILAGLLSVSAHHWVFWLGFQGGKGVAPTLGALMFVAPTIGVLYGISLLIAMGLTRDFGAGSALASLFLPFFFWFSHGDPVFTWLGITWGLIIVSKYALDLRLFLTKRGNL